MSATGTFREPRLFIGLMSGTSLDSIDAALTSFKDGHFQLIETLEHQLPNQLRQQLLDLCQPGENEINRMGAADRAMAKEFALAANLLLEQSQKKPTDIEAIGCHGQTIRHHPDGEHGFSLQIADPNTIAFETGIITVADFRRKDIAAGGQGAPLTPAFHNAVFSHHQHNRVIINIGGMANISCLNSDGTVMGFDTGPGNVLMDGWIQATRQHKYDKDGLWAGEGMVSEQLLIRMLSHPYFKQGLPKSTGREDFNQKWLRETINDSAIEPADVQATLLELTARTISDDICKLPQAANEVFICGGGAYNHRLMLRLETLLHPRLVANTAQLGIPAEWVEAAAFAWLAKQTLDGLAGNITTVTGASSSVVLGAIYPA